LARAKHPAVILLTLIDFANAAKRRISPLAPRMAQAQKKRPDFSERLKS